MPIYEYYCASCHTIYSFLCKSIKTNRRARCPDCGRADLEREISMFAMTGDAREPGQLDDLPIDESKMEQAMESLAGDSEGLDGEDPRQAARMMRKMSNMTGLKFGSGIEEALGRMEAGEDPETIEADMGDRLEAEDPFVLPGATPGAEGVGKKREKRPPRRDDTLYEL